MNGSLDFFLPYQQQWITSTAPLAIGEKSRRIGWTYASSYRAVERRIQGKGNLYFSSADLTAAREFIDYCRTWVDLFQAVAKYSEGEEVVDGQSVTKLEITFASGKRIVAGSSNPKFFRSKGGDADGDEFAFHADPRELFKAMHATALFWGHQLRLWSTHNGEGSYFAKMIQEAKAGRLKAELHKVTILDAVEQGIVEKIKKLKTRDDKARQEWLDELRSTCPDDDTWNEEYLCQPSSEQSSLLSYDLIRRCEDDTLPLHESIDQLPQRGVRLMAGFDVGRKKDLSVLWVLQQVGDVYHTALVQEFAGMPYTQQEEHVDRLCRNSCLRRVCIDSTGIGAMLAERLHFRYGTRAEPVNFSAPVKAELAMPLRRLFEDRLVRVPARAEIRDDLHKVRKVTTAAGNIRFEADRDEAGHADRFWALALAAHAGETLREPLPASVARKPVGW
jgi:phage FluMu gp28-like protein